MNFGGLQWTDDMLQQLMRMSQGGGGSLMGVNTPGINPSPQAQQELMGLAMKRPGIEKDSLGRPIGASAMGNAQGFSPAGEANNQFITNSAMNPMASGDTSTMAGLDPKKKMMLMVAQQLFNKSQERPEVPDVPVGANSVNVGAKPTLDPSNFTQAMRMQRGTPMQYSLGGGMLQDPRRRRNQFLFGV